MLDELLRWSELKAFRRFPRRAAKNIIDSRWVLKWKKVDGVRVIRARLTVRGFKDLQANALRTFAGTTSRWGQRLVNSEAAQRGWALFTADVSQAFLRGLTFEQAALMKGEIQREVQFDLPPGCSSLLNQLPGYEDFDALAEVLEMLRCGFGLKDAPRLWQKVLHGVLLDAGFATLQSDMQLYVLFEGGELQLLASTHVDDIKGAGTPKAKAKLLAALEAAFGTLKLQDGDFECVGVMHETCSDGSIWTHQHHYVKQLREISEVEFSMEEGTALASPAMHATYQSLVGALAWLTLTMVPIAVYVAWLQRQTKAPTYGNIRNANRLLRWIVRNVEKLGVRFVKLQEPLEITVISDSAFKALDTTGLVMRGCVVALREAGELRSGMTCRIQVLDWYAKKHAHVVRSTYAAELHSLLDAINQGLVLSYSISELRRGVRNARELVEMLNKGEHVVPMTACIDARAVFDNIIADLVKTPYDKHLLVHALAVREFLRLRAVTSLYWIDTNDMLADGLTKGCIDRTALIEASYTGVWKLGGLAPIRYEEPTDVIDELPL
jgi:hypothetical protein